MQIGKKIPNCRAHCSNRLAGVCDGFLDGKLYLASVGLHLRLGRHTAHSLICGGAQLALTLGHAANVARRDFGGDGFLFRPLAGQICPTARALVCIGQRAVPIYQTTSYVSGNEQGAPVAALTEEQVDKLREIMWAMNAVNCSTRAETAVIETTDKNGKETTTEITETVLVIELTHKTPGEMATDYHFTARQNNYLQLLQDPQYEQLWAELLGGFAQGGGKLMNPDSTRTPTGTLQWPLPVAGTITSQFGHRVDPITGEVSSHTGTDIACAEGTPILAAANGTVTVANGLDSWGGSYGYYIQIDHGGGLETLYAHCSSICVTTGQQVQAGEVIGYVGHTGRVTGNHLHLEVRIDGNRADVLRYFTL